MKIKRFTAPNITLALEKIREELGKEAVIVATEEQTDGVSVTAAIENDENLNFNENEKLEISPALKIYDDTKIRESLEYHDIVPDISGQILAIVRQINARTGCAENQILLAQALEKLCGFTKLLEGKKNKAFLGQTGSGKSTVIAKAAAKAKFNKMKSCIISTDNIRAGANTQLESFAKILETDFYFCRSARELFDITQAGQEKYDFLFIDTFGVNPYQSQELAELDILLEGLKTDKILVTDVGRNTMEAVETAEIFKNFGVDFILPTRFDMSRRIGSIISVACCYHMKFCAGSVSSNIAKGLAEITSKNLAKIILAEE